MSDRRQLGVIDRSTDTVVLTRAQARYADWSIDILIYTIVLNLFVEYVDGVVIDSFTISLLTAVLLKVMLVLLSKVEEPVSWRLRPPNPCRPSGDCIRSAAPRASASRAPWCGSGCRAIDSFGLKPAGVCRMGYSSNVFRNAPRMAAAGVTNPQLFTGPDAIAVGIERLLVGVDSQVDQLPSLTLLVAKLFGRDQHRPKFVPEPATRDYSWS